MPLPNLLLFDDHLYFRKSTIALLNQHTLFDKIWEAEMASEAINYLRMKNINIMLLDARLREGDGLDVMDYVRKEKMSVATIAITSYNDTANLLHLARSGVQGILLKSQLVPDELKLAIECVLQGQRYFAGNVYKLLEENLAVSDLPSIRLTDKEKELLYCLKEGFTSKEIATKLTISVLSAETYRKRLLEKTKTGSLPELIAFSFRNGLLR